MPEPRIAAFSTKELSDLFVELDGYNDMISEQLAFYLIKLDLLGNECANAKDMRSISKFIKWSISVSFLEMINAWSWFIAGIVLGRQGYFWPQVHQLYYYSIFFATKSYLAAHSKGNYTIQYKKNASGDNIPIRKSVYLNWNDKPEIILSEIRARGGEHESSAVWFYEVFNQSDIKNKFPDVLAFKGDERFFTGLRNWYTYALTDMCYELYEDPKILTAPETNDALVSLWHRDPQFVDYFPEVFWCLEHLKVITDLHLSLLSSMVERSPYSGAQIHLILNFVEHNHQAGTLDLLLTSMEPIISKCN